VGMPPFEYSLLFVGILAILGAVASKASSLFGVPSLLLFLLLGVAAGIHGPGQIAFSNIELAQEIGVLALTFILFSGGMDTNLTTARTVVKPALILSTLGVMFSTLVVALFAHQFLGLTLAEGGLLGATVSSTDVAAVFTLLRSKSVSLKGRIAPLLELESALNDPMTVFLSVGLLGIVLQQNVSFFRLVPLFFQQMIFGTVVGFLSGQLTCFAINRVKLEFEGLYPVFTIGSILVTYGVTQAVGGSGFLSVYIAGLVIGNKNILHKRSLIHFHEGIAWLMQIAMFLSMGLLVNPSELIKIAPLGIALSTFLVFVARPLTVFLCFPLKLVFSLPEKLVISWAGLRGAVPIILSTYILIARVPNSVFLFNLVFFVTFTSVLLQGTMLPLVARLLKVSLPAKDTFSFPIEFNPTVDLKNRLSEINLPKKSQKIGKSLIEINFPKDILLVLIERSGKIIIPRGGTKILEQDRLLVLSEKRNPEEVAKLLL
jgi:cell volume regulation protein A